MIQAANHETPWENRGVFIATPEVTIIWLRT
nr:MAG TPA: hypothetical protein [Caudoviricetes sp.]